MAIQTTAASAKAERPSQKTPNPDTVKTANDLVDFRASNRAFEHSSIRAFEHSSIRAFEHSSIRAFEQSSERVWTHASFVHDGLIEAHTYIHTKPILFIQQKDLCKSPTSNKHKAHTVHTAKRLVQIAN
jgi:hypothetical protein